MCKDILVHIHFHVHIHVLVNTQIYRTYMYVNTSIHPYIHICIHAYMHACIRACIHASIHAEIDAYSPLLLVACKMQPEGTHSLSLLVHAVMDSCDVPSSVYIIGTGCSRFCTIHTFQQQNSLDDSVPKSARHFFFLRLEHLLPSALFLY